MFLKLTYFDIFSKLIHFGIFLLDSKYARLQDRLVMDQVPENRFSGTQNQLKNGFKAS